MFNIFMIMAANSSNDVASTVVSNAIITEATHSIILNVLIIIALMLFCRIMYLKFSKNGRAFTNDIKKMKTLDKFAVDSLSAIYSRTLKEEAKKSEGLLENVKQQNSENDRAIIDMITSPTKVKIIKQFEIKFSKDDEIDKFVLVDVSQNYLNLFSVNSFLELKGKYAIRKTYPNNNIFSDEMELLHKKIPLEDVISIEPDEWERIMSQYESIKNNEFCDITLIRDSVCVLHTILLNAKIYINYDVRYNGKYLIVNFNINKIVPLFMPGIGSNRMQAYPNKDIIQSLLISLPYPFFIIDKDGVKFCNKCACDWLNIPYNKSIKQDQKASIERIFSIIDEDLPHEILQVYNSDSMEYIFNSYILNLEGDSIIDIERNLSIVKTPKEVMLQCIPYNNVDNERELVITLYNASMFKEYMNMMRFDDKDNKVNKEMDKMIDKLMLINKLFKTFFKNTDMISFARIDLTTKDIVVCNKSFEELIKFDDNKDKYLSVIYSIIDDYDPDTEKINNFYVYDINYADRELKVVYTYSPDKVMDVIFIERNVRQFVSNHSLDLLGSLYETSDLPIIVVDKTGRIIRANSKFVYFFMDNCEDVNIKQISDMNLNLLNYVPSTERNKVKRAIYDAIKYNSYAFNDSIIMSVKDINQQYHQCKLSCIKTYGKVNENEFITITIFPE